MSVLEMPSFDLPENPTNEQLRVAMANAILSIAANLQRGRREESDNAIAIRALERRVEQLETAVLP